MVENEDLVSAVTGMKGFGIRNFIYQEKSAFFTRLSNSKNRLNIQYKGHPKPFHPREGKLRMLFLQSP